MSALELSEVLRHAQRVLEDISVEERELRIAQYVKLFEQWFQQVQSSANLSVEDRPAVEQLGTLHQSIIDITNGMQGDAVVALRGLRTKGKGLLAYTVSAHPQAATFRPRRKKG